MAFYNLLSLKFASSVNEGVFLFVNDSSIDGTLFIV